MAEGAHADAADPRTQSRRRLPADVVDYSHWNAHSIFFFDPAGNVVEYIARHDLKTATPAVQLDATSFTPARSAYRRRRAATAARLGDAAVTSTRVASDQFVAMGDEYGLLLVMKRGRVIDFTSNPHHGAHVYSTGVTVRGPKTGKQQIGHSPYILNVE